MPASNGGLFVLELVQFSTNPAEKSSDASVLNFAFPRAQQAGDFLAGQFREFQLLYGIVWVAGGSPNVINLHVPDQTSDSHRPPFPFIFLPRFRFFISSIVQFINLLPLNNG